MNHLGCIFLEEGINFDYSSVTDCCISHNDGRGLPLLIDNYHGEMLDWNKIFEIKENRIKEQLNKTIYDCEKCYRLSEYKFKHQRKISEFHFSHCRTCNSKCVYCSKEYNDSGLNYDTYPIIKDLIEKGFYSPGGEATFQGGEPLLMHHFNELIELFTSNGTKVRVHSSGIKYSHEVEKALKNDNGTIVISLDSSNRETYKKIKRVDCFDKVVENIEKYSYANSNNITIKYIIVPGYNDNLYETDNFLTLMKKLGIKNIALDIDCQYARKYDNKNLSAHIYLIMDYFENKAKKLGFNLLIYSFISYVKRDRTVKHYPFINFKPIYSLFVSALTEKTKNLSY